MVDLAGFSIGEMLQSGAHFSVYRATRHDDGAAVIIKIADSSQVGSQANARLDREFALTRALDDPAIATAEALGRSGRCSYLVFPDEGRVSLATYLEGRSLPMPSF